MLFGKENWEMFRSTTKFDLFLFTFSFLTLGHTREGEGVGDGCHFPKRFLQNFEGSYSVMLQLIYTSRKF